MRVDPGDNVALSVSDGDVPARSLDAFGVIQHLNAEEAAVPRGKLFHDPSCAVCGTAVDKNDFRQLMGVGLPLDIREKSGQMIFFIQRNDTDG